MSHTRQLAAIAFADIEGYTALVQADEGRAKSIRDKFMDFTQRTVPSYNGRIVQFTGDGAVCFFNSSVDAVLAAVSVQQHMLQEPKVPLRIGIHSGDVIIEDNDIFGDGVNLASRIESFAIPGSVLISDKVFLEIKNKAGIQAKSIGKYFLKNVSYPVEIFAITNENLVVPERRYLQGKGRKITGRKWLPVAGYMAIALILLFAGLKYFDLIGNKTAKIFPSTVLQSRIAILPFENKTNDSSLNMFGTMAADYIIQSLLNLANLKVVMFNSIEANLPYTSGGSGKESFARRTGAEKIIMGSVYNFNNKLLVQSRLIDARTGEVEIVLPEMEGSKNDPQSLVKELATRFTGYFATREDVLSLKMIPKYEAYLKFREMYPLWGIDVAATRKILSEAIAMDSAFLYPYLFSFASYFNYRQWKEADSVMKIIDRKFDKPTAYEQEYIRINKSMLAGNYQEAFSGWKKQFERDPKNINTNIWAAGMAMANWKYKEALEIFRRIDPSQVNYDAAWKLHWTRSYAICLVRLRLFEEIGKIISSIPSEQPLYAAEPLLYSYILRGEHDSAKQVVDQLNRNNAVTPRQIDSLYVLAAERYALIHDTVHQLQFARVAIERLKSNQKKSAVLESKAYYLAGQFQNSASVAQKAPGTQWDILSRLGCSYVRMGLKEKAVEIVSRIRSIKTPYVRGEDSYALAEILAALGEKEKSVEYLRKAFKEGRAMLFGFYEEDADFVPLHGYKEYEEFVVPKK